MKIPESANTATRTIFKIQYSTTNGDMWVDAGWRETRNQAQQKCSEFLRAGHFVRVVEEIVTYWAIKTEGFRVRLKPGRYKAVTNSMIILFNGNQEVETVNFSVGDMFEIGKTANNYWYALQGTQFDEAPSILEVIDLLRI